MTASPPRFAGFGLGLRKPHYADFLNGEVAVDFLEIISENYMVEGGRPLFVLDTLAERFPIAMHGVSMSIGSAKGLDRDYLRRLKRLADRVKPLFLSDHLCWTNADGRASHDLLPLPYTEEAMEIVCANIAVAQDMLERPMLFENPSSYVAFPDADYTEWAFLAEMCARTGCHLLLDVNNIYVSATNHGLDAQAYLEGIPAARVRQMHLAGHTQGPILIDTHDHAVCADVWRLYARACERFGPVATMIERDDDIPPLSDLLAELQIARDIAAGIKGLAA
ncbi:MAG: DUF692 domain-containing protein [Alphaproteobacteria bacterium]|nr:DUF692 domain-containing protein [Alphaproteobacteria bacterium]